MTKLRLIFITLIPLLVAVTRAQTKPLVVFIESQALDTAALTNQGGGGVSELARVFLAQGAEIRRVDLSVSLPPTARVAVLVRPLRRMRATEVARLVEHLENGNNLLLAVDPENYYLGSTNVNTQLSRTGIVTILDQDYGLLIQNTFLVEPWFSSASINQLQTSFSLSYPDAVMNPITAPLVQYGLPVWMWGARHLEVRPLSVRGNAIPLLYAGMAYGESDSNIFKSAREDPTAATLPAPLTVDLDADFIGRLNTAAVGEDVETGARVAVLGDSEMLQNGYGMALDNDLPRYPGNRIFVQRLAAWLLEKPEEEWPPLSDDFTWLSLDGDSADWSTSASTVVDVSGDAAQIQDDLQEVRAFSDDLYAYVLLRTSVPPALPAFVGLQMDAGTKLIVGQGRAVLTDEDGTLVEMDDVGFAVGNEIEIRVPLRVIPPTLRLADVCLEPTSEAAGESPDCVGQPVDLTHVNTRAPFDYALSHGLLVVVSSAQPLNLRSGPGTNFEQITGLLPNTILRGIGRNADGSWVKVQSALYTGWVTAEFVTANGDISWLPLVDQLLPAEETPSPEETPPPEEKETTAP